jgi:hypothetical protein
MVSHKYTYIRIRMPPVPTNETTFTFYTFTGIRRARFGAPALRAPYPADRSDEGA